MMGAGMKKIAFRQAFLPGLRPRFRALFASGFQYIPWFVALVYGAVRLLPEGHPYLDSRNMGRFGLRHVIAEAANNIVFSRRNIDQIVLFVTILMGMGIIFMQFLLLGLAIFMQPAAAAMPTNFAGFFLTPPTTRDTDLAGMLLDLVFGVPDIFESCVSRMIPCTDAETGANINASVAGTNWALEPAAYPMHIHVGLHQVFQIYSLGLLVVATLISLYFIATIILETAESGTPFGKRFNRVWAPVRIVMAFGLLIPVGYGLNSAQYIVLYAAKFGSGFATNGWNLFNDSLGANVKNLLTAQNTTGQSLVSQPNPPEVGTLLQFLFVAKTCAEVEAADYERKHNGASPAPEQEIRPYIVDEPFKMPKNNLRINETTTYDDIMKFIVGTSSVGKNQVIIRFGIEDEKNSGFQLGWVAPTCGELVMRLADPRLPGVAEPGIEAMQRYYFFIIHEMWYEEFQTGIISGFGQPYPEHYMRHFTTLNQDTTLPLPGPEYKTELQDFYATDLRSAMNNPAATGLDVHAGISTGAVIEMQNSARWDVDNVLREKGWAGAAIWYNRVAEMNGNIISSILNIPMPSRYPRVMENVYAQKRQQEKNITFRERFKPVKASGQGIDPDIPVDMQTAGAYWEAFDYWQQGDSVTTPHSTPTGNAVIDILNALMGTEGLFDMRRNPDVHPLAQLTGLGRSMVEGAIRNLSYASVAGAGGALLSKLSEFIGASASVVSSFLITFSLLALTIGFVLFYIVPLLPFIYFFFAVGGWIKAIFEAMVGLPLWALAHIRIDGNGLSGQAAITGYFLIFEIFLRPILMVFSLLASIAIFSALVSVLNQIFDLVVSNTGGFDVNAEFTGAGASKLTFMRSAIDEFFYTAVYAVIVYLMALSSFKLVELIPNNIMRWMGSAIKPFNEGREDAAQSLVGTSTVGMQQLTSAIGQPLKHVAKMGQGA